MSGFGWEERDPYFLPVLFPAFSLTVVFGFLVTVDCLTNLPVMALRPRLLPEVFLLAIAIIPSCLMGIDLHECKSSA